MICVTQLVKNSKTLLNLQKLVIDFTPMIKATSTPVDFEDCAINSDSELEDWCEVGFELKSESVLVV